MLKSLSISTRISMMAAALLLVCVTAACTGWLGSRSLFASLDTYADFSAKTLQTVAAERDYVSLRGRSFNYIVTGNAEDGKRVRAYFDTFPGIIDELVANNATTPALVESARVLRQKFADYLDALRNVVQIYGTSGSQAALVAYEAKVDAQSRELSPVFTDLRTQRFAVLAQIKARSLESYDETLMFIVGVSLVGLAVGIVLAVIIARGIIRPLNQMTEAMTRLSRGDASVTVPSAHGEDELSHMARAVGIFAANAETIASMTKAEETTQEIGAAISKAAGGDLTTRVSIEGKTGFLRDIGCEVNRLLEGMNKAFGDFSGKARSTAISICEASSAVGQVSEGARSQNGQLAQVALALTETSAAISDVSSGTRTASEKAVNASRAVDLGLQSVARLTTIMQSIGQNGRKINQLTQVIGEIANRTHILSLNAAIEAARAGEHGKGFVVVAQEVGKLAESAGQNAKQIAEIVEQATLDTTEGRSATDNVKAMMESISAGTADTSTVIQSVVVAIEEQQATVKRIDENVGELRTIAASNSAAAEEISATMVHLAGLADETREQISRFKTA